MAAKSSYYNVDGAVDAAVKEARQLLTRLQRAPLLLLAGRHGDLRSENLLVEIGLMKSALMRAFYLENAR